MKRLESILLLLPLFLFFTANAYGEANWKRGRIYYRMVCTACHLAEAGKSISPSSRTIAEWKAYMDADKHATASKAEKKVSDYVSMAYRQKIKDTNKAAAKLINLSDKELFQDVRAFVVHGAKDSDTPASCQ